MSAGNPRNLRRDDWSRVLKHHILTARTGFAWKRRRTTSEAIESERRTNWIATHAWYIRQTVQSFCWVRHIIVPGSSIH